MEDETLKNKTLILIDGHALAFRMYFALERTNMQTTSHEPTWAVYGFFKAVFDLLSDKKLNLKPNAIAVAFDISKDTFRVEKYKEYKANRLAMPDALRSQLELIKEGLEAFEIPVYIKKGYEGDDIIGTIAHQAKKQGHKTYILTGDRDAFQLVDDEGLVTILIPSKGELLKYNKKEVFEKMEVYPEQIVDYKALCGDSSDNIPGIKGIGAKSAVSLLREYKTLDSIYDNIDKISKKALKEKLINGKDIAYLSQYLAKITEDVDIDFDFAKACLNVPNKDNAAKYLQKLQFYTFIKKTDKILSLFKNENSCKNSNEIAKSIPKENDIKEGQICLFDFDSMRQKERTFEHLSLDEIKNGDTIGILSDENDRQYCYISKDNKALKILFSEAKAIIENPDIKKITYDVKSIDLNIKNVVCDVQLASYIKDSSRKHDLITQINEYLKALPDEKDYFSLALYLPDLFEFYNGNLTKKELDLLNNVELPLAFVLKDMEETGVKLDVEYLKIIDKEIMQRVKEYEKKIFDVVGYVFNINSPKQVAEALFERLQITPRKKGKSGNFSTGAKILEDLAAEYEIAADILEHRQLMKLKSTYIDVLPKLIKEDGKIHTHFNQIVTTTGRLSSSDPNLQNIPIRTEFSNRIRGGFVPFASDSVIFSADYSQVELRLLAHYSGDKTLLESFINNIDVHSMTASKIYNTPINMVTKKQRRVAKTVNFGIIYGQTRYGLAQTLKITPAEAQELINKYFKTYPGILDYMNETIKTAQSKGYVETLYGRRRYLGAELNSRNANIREFAHRAAINAPLQGTSADIIKMAMVDLHSKLKNYKSKMILQIHDELVLEVPDNEIEDVKNLTVASMEMNQPLKVPLRVEVGYGKTWMEK